MQNVLDLERQTLVSRNDSYIISYPHILSYFTDLEVIGVSDLVRGAHMVYGWMPTVLNLYPYPPNKSLSDVALLLTQVKNGGDLTNEQILDIAAVVNNSLVGASKLLHFIAPHKYAIWDSKIYTFVHGNKAHAYRVGNTDHYINYLHILNAIKKEPTFSQFHRSIIEKMGYDVSALRAIELVMFLNPPVLND